MNPLNISAIETNEMENLVNEKIHYEDEPYLMSDELSLNQSGLQRKSEKKLRFRSLSKTEMIQAKPLKKRQR